MSPRPLLWCHRESGHSYKAALALALMDVDCELRAVDLNQSRDRRPSAFQRASRFGEVPALEIDGLLARRYGRLDANDMADSVRVREWLAWEANRLAMSFPHLRFSRRFSRADAALEAWWTQRMHADFDRLDAELRDRAFLVGDAPTIADVSCCGYLYWTGQAGVDLAPWPDIQSWLERIAALPGWRAPYDLMPEGAPILDGTRT